MLVPSAWAEVQVPHDLWLGGPGGGLGTVFSLSWAP